MDKFKTISSIGLVGFLGLIVWLFIRIEGYKDAKVDQARELYRVNWLLEAKEKENVKLREFGEYAIPDTVWDSIPIPYPVHDTLPPDTFYAQIPRVWGHFEIDTVVGLGLKANPLYVRVEGEVYYPKEYESMNWLKVYQDSLDIWNPPVMPPDRSQAKRWGLGLSYLRSFSSANAGDYFGGSVRYKRFTVVGSYDPWRKSLISGISYELFTF